MQDLFGPALRCNLDFADSHSGQSDGTRQSPDGRFPVPQLQLLIMEKSYLRLVRSADGQQAASAGCGAEVQDVQLNYCVTPTQAEAIDLLNIQWDREDLLPGSIAALEEDLEAAIRNNDRDGLCRVIGMADGLTLVLDIDPRIERIRERAMRLAGIAR